MYSVCSSVFHSLCRALEQVERSDHWLDNKACLLKEVPYPDITNISAKLDGPLPLLVLERKAPREIIPISCTGDRARLNSLTVWLIERKQQATILSSFFLSQNY